MSGFRDRLFAHLNRQAAERPGDLFGGERWPAPSSRPGPSDPLDARFLSEAESAGATVLDLAGVDDREASVAGQLRDLGGGTAAVDADPDWERVGLSIPGVLERAGVELLRVDGSVGGKRLADVDLGVTLADLAIAETGTIVQWVQPFRPRSLSLVPPAHLVVVPRARLVAGLEDMLERAADGGQAAGGCPDYFTWITGPSRTADIEKVLTIGVHGPGRLLVVLLPEETHE